MSPYPERKPLIVSRSEIELKTTVGPYTDSGFSESYNWRSELSNRFDFHQHHESIFTTLYLATEIVTTDK